MESFKNAITEMTILKNSLVKLSKDLYSIDLGCIGPGQVSLYLGDNWFVSVEKADALGIIERRIEFLNAQISNLQFAALKSEMSDFVEIVEQDTDSTNYVMPSDNKYCNQEKQTGEFEENLFKLIESLENQEIADATDAEDVKDTKDVDDDQSENQISESESLESIPRNIQEKRVHFAPDTKSDELKIQNSIKTPVKQLVVEREIESFDDDSDLENYHIGRQVAKDYVRLRDRINISEQELEYKGRGLDKFQPKLSQFKKRSLETKEI